MQRNGRGRPKEMTKFKNTLAKDRQCDHLSSQAYFIYYLT